MPRHGKGETGETRTWSTTKCALARACRGASPEIALPSCMRAAHMHIGTPRSLQVASVAHASSARRLLVIYTVFARYTVFYHAHVAPGLRIGMSSLTRPADLILSSFLCLSSACNSALVFPSLSTTCIRACGCILIPARPRPFMSYRLIWLGPFVTQDSAARCSACYKG